MFKIRLIKNLKTGSVHISKGTVMTARVRPGNPFDLSRPYQVIEGPHSGLDVPIDCAVPLPVEKLYTEAEYNKLVNEQEALKKHFDELLGVYKSVSEEKRLLQEEINQLVAGKKVPLPQGVAEALKCAQERFSEPSIMKMIDLQKDGYGLSAVYCWVYAAGTALEIQRKTLIMRALVNGYTIDETPRERIKRGVQEIYDEWTTIPTTGDDQKDGDDLAERISRFVTQELQL
ncbi:hypothetical protein [Brevibacillus borstelensis]